jgi:hypothetical protein
LDFCHWGTVRNSLGGQSDLPPRILTAKGPNSSIEKKASRVGLLFVIAVGIPSWGQLDFRMSAGATTGVFGAAALIFFAFLGFDELGNLAEEMRRPERDLSARLVHLARCDDVDIRRGCPLGDRARAGQLRTRYCSCCWPPPDRSMEWPAPACCPRGLQA